MYKKPDKRVLSPYATEFLLHYKGKEPKRCVVAHLTKILSIILLVLSFGTQAETVKINVPQLYEVQQPQWRAIDREMSRQEYKDAYRKNRRILVKSVSNYMEQQFTALGVPEMGVSLAAKTIGFAVSGAKINLNESKTMALEVRDVTQEDRGVYFKVKFDW